MRIMFVYLPIVVLVVGWLLGRCRITRAIVCLAVMMLSAQVLIIVSLSKQEPVYLLLAVLLSLFGIIGAVAFSFATSRQVSPAPVHYAAVGVQKAAKAYQGLDPDTKSAIHKGTRLVAKFGAKHLGNHLRDKGYARTADALQQGGRLI
ncbi:MAG: hypothetical protein JWL87_710 [Candidatus Adlerbacteria bacterium]|nr:hypothetical protein [Candidatus Adlerbacteria bacterium]